MSHIGSIFAKESYLFAQFLHLLAVIVVVSSGLWAVLRSRIPSGDGLPPALGEVRGVPDGADHRYYFQSSILLRESQDRPVDDAGQDADQSDPDGTVPDAIDRVDRSAERRKGMQRRISGAQNPVDMRITRGPPGGDPRML